MSRLGRHFSTDWSAMTTSDWIGLIVTVGIFILMIVAYFYVLRPGSKERLEKHKNIVMDDDDSHEKEDMK